MTRPEAGVRRSLTVFRMMTGLLLFFVELGGLYMSPAYARKRLNVEALVNSRAAFFVALSGSDANPGTADHPWATINHAAEKVKARDTVVVRGGRYFLATQVRARNSGRPGAWITFIGYPGEEPVLDARFVQRPAQAILNNGAFQIEGASHIRVANLTVVNSHDAGFTIRDSSDIDLINNSTNGTFSSGIAVWATNHDQRTTKRIRILANSITNATFWDFAPSDVAKLGEPPHEALSIGGAVDFEVAYNHVYNNGKEGIDIKETSRRGKVHHNLVHNVERQGIYVDAWFGKISDIEIFSNVIHDCVGAGFVLSVENGKGVEYLSFHNNLIFNNDGSGLYFSRWGADNKRRNISIFRNIFFHNGYGRPEVDQAYYWQTGGIYLYSANIQNVSIRNNILSENRGFQIGYSELFLNENQSWQAVAGQKKIHIADNLIFDPDKTYFPIESGGRSSDRVKIYPADGERALYANPLFRDAPNQDFTLLSSSPAAKRNISLRIDGSSSPSHVWWKENFPPKLARRLIR